jgi:hypothetical protein
VSARRFYRQLGTPTDSFNLIVSSNRKYQELRIFVAGPGDVTAEKERLSRIVDRLQGLAQAAGFFLNLKEWRQVVPDMHRPQQVIFDQIAPQSWDIFIGVLWMRFGSRSGATHPATGLPLESGTHEEFLTVYRLWKEHGKPRILFYRCNRSPERLDQIDPEQLAKVKIFFAEFETAGAHPGIYKSYVTLEEFSEFAYDHLSAVIRSESEAPLSQSLGASSSDAFVDLDAYRVAIRRRYRHLQLETLSADQTHYQDIELQSVFIAQDVRNCEQWLPEALEGPKEMVRPDVNGPEEGLKLAQLRYYKDFRRQQPQNVFKVFHDPRQRLTVILGDPGAGKSSLALVELLEWAALPDPNERPLPVLIELRHYHQNAGGKDFLDYLEKSKEILFCFPAVMLRKRLEEGTVRILFDGLDEVFDAEERNAVAMQIAQLARKEARLVVTSRLVGYPKRTLRDAGFQHWLLEDFDDQKIGHFLENWCSVAVREEANRERVHQRVEVAIQVPAVRELAGNPLLLTMMAMLARQSDLPRDQFTLYQRCSSLLLELWDTQKAIDSDITLSDLKILIDAKDKQTVLRRLAWRMQNDLAGLRGNLVLRSTLEEIMDKALILRIADEGWRRQVIKRVIDQLRERNFILCHLGSEYYAFVHRGFLEYFCTEEILNAVVREPSKAVERLKGIFTEHCKEDAWSQVLALTANALESAVADEVLAPLVEIEADEKELRPLWLAYGVLRRARDPLALAKTTPKEIFDHVFRRIYSDEEVAFDIDIGSGMLQPNASKENYIFSCMFSLAHGSSLAVNQAMLAADILDAALVTDSPLHHKLLALKFRRASESPQSIPDSFPNLRYRVPSEVLAKVNILSFALIDSLLPDEVLTHLSVAECCRYRDTCQDSRLRFQEHLLKLTTEIECEVWDKKLESEISKLILGKVIPEARKLQDDISQVAGKLLGNLAVAGATVAAPSLVASLYPSMGHIMILLMGSSAAAGGAIALAAKEVTDHVLARRQLRKNGLSYLIELKNRSQQSIR